MDWIGSEFFVFLLGQDEWVMLGTVHLAVSSGLCDGQCQDAQDKVERENWIMEFCQDGIMIRLNSWDMQLKILRYNTTLIDGTRYFHEIGLKQDIITCFKGTQAQGWTRL